jgi:predicted phosphodiesterase
VRIFVAGDTHGNGPWWSYLLPQASLRRADVVVQVGDFGFWEHSPSGVAYLDQAEDAADEHGLTIYALHGNHDNWSLVMRRYGERRDPDGFVIVRPHIRYIPQGHIWTWAGVRIRAFGGAYSVDKHWRLDYERKLNRRDASRAEGRRDAGLPAEPAKDYTGSLWFPDEEMTDAEFAELMCADAQNLDLVFSHDKPRGSNPGLPLKDDPECRPNQDRLQLALVAHQPAVWVHGHLHHPYTDQVRSGDDDRFTTVIGLSCDDRAAPRFWKPEQSWCLVDLTDGDIAVRTGSEVLDG